MYENTTKAGNIIINSEGDFSGPVLMKYRSNKTDGMAVFPNLEIAEEAADWAVAYEHGGYHEVILSSGEDLEITHNTAIQWLHD